LLTNEELTEVFHKLPEQCAGPAWKKFIEGLCDDLPEVRDVEGLESWATDVANYRTVYCYDAWFAANELSLWNVPALDELAEDLDTNVKGLSDVATLYVRLAVRLICDAVIEVLAP
jgi:hypothetical protein